MQIAQQKAADLAGATAITLGGVSLTVTDVLQITALILSIVCGLFSLYFHVKKYLRERRK